jgi:hypothetical protein
MEQTLTPQKEALKQQESKRIEDLLNAQRSEWDFRSILMGKPQVILKSKTLPVTTLLFWETLRELKKHPRYIGGTLKRKIQTFPIPAKEDQIDYTRALFDIDMDVGINFTNLEKPFLDLPKEKQDDMHAKCKRWLEKDIVKAKTSYEIGFLEESKGKPFTSIVGDKYTQFDIRDILFHNYDDKTTFLMSFDWNFSNEKIVAAFRRQIKNLRPSFWRPFRENYLSCLRLIREVEYKGKPQALLMRYDTISFMRGLSYYRMQSLLEAQGINPQGYGPLLRQLWHGWKDLSHDVPSIQKRYYNDLKVYKETIEETFLVMDKAEYFWRIDKEAKLQAAAASLETPK